MRLALNVINKYHKSGCQNGTKQCVEIGLGQNAKFSPSNSCGDGRQKGLESLGALFAAALIFVISSMIQTRAAGWVNLGVKFQFWFQKTPEPLFFYPTT